MLGLRYCAVCACIVAGLCLGLSSWGWADDDDDSQAEIEVSIKDVPAPVKATILKQAGKNKIDEIEQIAMKFYEAEWLVGDIEVEICVSARGRVESIEVEAAHDDEDEENEDGDDEEEEEGNEKKVKLNRVPKPVKRTILRLADGKKIAEIEEVTKTVYEAEWTVKDKEVEILVSSKGRLLRKKVEEADDDDDDDDDDN